MGRDSAQVDGGRRVGVTAPQKPKVAVSARAHFTRSPAALELRDGLLQRRRDRNLAGAHIAAERIGSMHNAPTASFRSQGAGILLEPVKLSRAHSHVQLCANATNAGAL